MISRPFRLVAASLLFVALLGLTIVSLEQIYVVVVKSFLTANGMPKIFWVGALVSAAIPVGFLVAYSCIAFVVYVRKLWNLMSHQSSP